MSRTIVVDDNDSGITYSGAWFKDDSGSLNTIGNFGPPMLGTLHGTNSTASFTYTFSGTEFTVTNTNQFNNPTGLNITCLLDNESVPVVISTVPVNNVMLCNKGGLADTQHTFVLNAVVTNQETFWFDYLHYVPSASVPTTKAPLLIAQDDGELQSGFGAGWKKISPGFQTTQTGAQFTFPFTGVSLTWYGFYDPSMPWNRGLKTAAYSIDGGSPILFNTLVDVANGADKPAEVRYNQVLFQTDDLPNTDHNLQVIFQGTNTSTPLTLEFLVVNPNPRDTAVSATSTTPSFLSSSSAATATSSVLPSISGSPKKVINIGMIAGAVIGAVTIVALVAIILFVFLRRQKNGYRRPTIFAPDMEGLVLPFEPILNQSHSYALPQSTKTFNSLSTNMNTSYVNPAQISDPFSDSSHAPASTSHPQALASMMMHSYGMPVVELTPNGRLIHPNNPSPSNGGKGRIPRQIATTVIQAEDSGVRLPQSPDHRRVEILPPSYSWD